MTKQRINDLRKLLAGSLPRGHRLLHGALAVLFLAVLGNTVFLLARRYVFGCELSNFDGCAVSIFYQAMVLLHSGIGILLTAAIVWFVVYHVRKNWTLAKVRTYSLITGASSLLLFGFLLASGFYFLLEAKSESTAWLYYSHMGAALIMLAVYVMHRHLARPALSAGVGRALAGVAAAVAVVLVAVEVTVAPETPPPPQIADLKDNDGTYEAPSKVSSDHLFFPSPVQLAGGKGVTEPVKLWAVAPEYAPDIRKEVEEHGFAFETPIGAEKCVRCHEETVRQWSSSVHRFSSFNNPYYVATIDFLRETTPEDNPRLAAHLEEMGMPPELSGKARSRWCAACHDPVLLFAGKMTEDIDRGTPEAQSGLVCLSCHNILAIPNHTGNGNYVWNETFEDSYIFSGSRDGIGAELHDLYLSANPERHRSDMLKPFFKQSGFCATCHKVSLDVAVNDYRWLRGQNEFDSWHSSGVAHNAARTFYLPPAKRECQDCHMPQVDAKLPDRAAEGGKIRSHFFGSVNTALPFIRGDQEAIAQIEKFLQDDKLRVHFGGVRALGEEHATALAVDGVTVVEQADGRALELHVVVRNLGVGHTFPGGTNDSNEAWLEVTALDANGRPLGKVGAIEENGEVARNTRFFNALFVDKDGKRIDKRNAQEIVTPVYVRVIAPGTADVSRFSLPAEMLAQAEGPITVKARLMWRKFNQTYNRFAWESNREGFAKFDVPPELPITEIAAATMTVEHAEDGLRLVTSKKGLSEAIGLHDYAIGLLRQGDTLLATEMAGKASAADATCYNCRRTHAATLLNAGEFARARDVLTALEKDNPRDPQTAWLWGRLLLREGDYGRAEKALQHVLNRFPEDREALKLLSRVRYLNGQMEPAVQAAKAALVIDPEDSTANYYAMLAAKAAGKADEAAYYETAFRYHKRDELQQQASLSFREVQSEFNFVSQQIQVFELQ